MPTSLFDNRKSVIHRLNPVTKLVALLAIIVIVFAIPVWWVSAIVLVVVIVPAAVISGSGGRLLSLSLKILIPILLVLFIVQGLTFPGGETILWRWGVLKLTTEGLLFALGVGSRIIVLILASILLVLTTHPGQLMSALSEHGMSPKFAYIISSTLQLIPAFSDRANSILLAQQARGLSLKGSPFRRIKVMLPLLSPLVLGMFTDVEERSTAMEARAFGSPAKRTSLIPVPDTTLQRVLRWVFVALALGAIATPILMGIL
ncbi:MAG: energy-coupling factor transporter transmembrane protein EcfT [Cryobacterium sp.]|nr:energy-coupling factor transporter transmembrane protein EcfT [Cryobacterium sp.]MBX3104085.1 energy-coupling factor transporter transmembrane protein EcfT [Cryobacterium sp.]